jgi:hypothetical protein
MNKTVKISEVKVNPNNPRLIKDDKFKKLVQSVLDFNIDDNELTKQAMNLSTSSFSEEWDKEDDGFWKF